MSKDFLEFLTFQLAILGIAFIGYIYIEYPNKVVYDCRTLIGGWHPDIPQKVQEDCRKKLSGRI